MKCSQCGEEHELLEPAYRRPDAFFDVPEDARATRVKDSDDLCTIRGEDGRARRNFVRAVLPVKLVDIDDVACWGLWAELSALNFRTVVETWDDEDQSALPLMDATIANHVPGYPETIGMHVSLRLMGRTGRPQLSVDDDDTHPFAVEVRSGVTVHRLVEWLKSMQSADL